MSVPPPRSDRRTRGTLALLLGATLWAALGDAAPVAAQPVLVIDSIIHSPASVVAGGGANLDYTFSLSNTATGTSDDETAAVLRLSLVGSPLVLVSDTLPGLCLTLSSPARVECPIGPMSNGPGGTSNVTGYIRFNVAANAAAGLLSSTFELYGAVDTTVDSESEDVTVTTSADLDVTVTMTAPVPNKVVPGNSVSYTDRTHQQRSVGRGGGDARLSRRPPVSAPRPTVADCDASHLQSGDDRPRPRTRRRHGDLHRSRTTTTSGHGTSPVDQHRHAATDDARCRRGRLLRLGLDAGRAARWISRSSLSSAATSVTPGMPATYLITVSKTGPSRLDRVHIDDNQTLRLLGAVFTPSEGIFSAIVDLAQLDRPRSRRHATARRSPSAAG